MGVFPVGGQRVGIVTDAQQLDGGGNPIVSEFMEPQTAETVVWVDGCQVEVWVQRVDEIQGETTTTAEPTKVFMPVNTDTLAFVADPFSSNKALRFNGRNYPMRGDAVLEYDIRGRADHVFCHCEHQGG